MPSWEEGVNMSKLKINSILLVLLLFSAVAVFLAFPTSALPTSEEFKIKPKLEFLTEGSINGQAYVVPDEDKEIIIEFTKDYTIASGSSATVFESVANPSRTKIESLDVGLDVAIRWKIEVFERNSTTDAWSVAYSLSGLVGSQKLVTIPTVKSLYFKIVITNLDATTTGTFTVHPKIVIETPAVDTVIGGVNVKGIAIPASYASNGDTSWRVVRAYAEFKFKPLFKSSWYPLAGFTVSYTAPTGVEVKEEYVKTEIVGVTSDADTFKPTLQAGTEYTVHTILDINVTNAPGAFISSASGKVSIRVKDVEVEATVKLTWPNNPASYQLSTPKLVDMPSTATYTTIVDLTEALIDTASVSIQPAYTGQSVSIELVSPDTIIYSSASTTEAILSWRTSFAPSLTKYSKYDPAKTSVSSIVKDDEIVFESTPYISGSWLRLYDASGKVVLEAKALTVKYAVSPGKYTERLVLDHEGLAHYALEHTVDIVGYPVLRIVKSSPANLSETVSIDGKEIQLGKTLDTTLAPGRYKAVSKSGVFAWYVYVHSALPSYFDITLPFSERVWTSKEVKAFANIADFMLAEDADMPKKAFRVTATTGNTDLTVLFVEGSLPLRVIVNGYEGSFSQATFRGVKGYMIPLAKNNTAYTVDVKYPALVKLIVLGRDGKPVEGAKVKFEHYTSGVRDALYQTTTDANGSAVMSVEPFPTDYQATINVGDYTGSFKILVNDDVSKTVKLEVTAPPPPAPTIDWASIFIVVVAVLAIAMSAYFILKSRTTKAEEPTVRFEL